MPREPDNPPGPALAELLARIADRRAVVGVVGLGYVGLRIAAAFVHGGFRVLGVDRDARRVEQLRRGETPRRHLGTDFAATLRDSGRFEATTDTARLAEADALLICVPTPLGAGDVPDLSDVRDAATAIARTLRPGRLIVLESTTYPGTTREVLLPLLQRGAAGAAGPDAGTASRTRGNGTAPPALRCGREIFVAFSPEREDPGREQPSTRSIPRLVGGLDAPSREAAVALYGAVLDRVVPVDSAEIAEAAKLLENIYRAVNIAMVNEMKVLLTAMGIDIEAVIDAAATKPFGFEAFRPGPGWGGHCIPIDPFYLAWKAAQAGQEARFIALAGEVNRAMPDYVIARTRAALAARRDAGPEGRAASGAPGAAASGGGGDSRSTDPLSGAQVLVLGLAYKRDIDDVRESPSLQLIARLAALGAHVAYHDPHLPAIPEPRGPGVPALRSVPLDAATLARMDAVVIATDHGAVDYELVARAARLIVDTRGVLRGRPGVVPA